jgi:hypothetical protein
MLKLFQYFYWLPYNIRENEWFLRILIIFILVFGTVPYSFKFWFFPQENLADAWLTPLAGTHVLHWCFKITIRLSGQLRWVQYNKHRAGNT